MLSAKLSGRVCSAASRLVILSHRGVSVIPASGKTPPKLEDFDPLNPGEWQLGAGGRILPRLPEGTRCGKLVMGKYGLYDPKLRAKIEAYQAGLDAGLKSEEARPFDRRLRDIAKVIAYGSFVFTILNILVLINGKPFWPASLYIKERHTAF